MNFTDLTPRECELLEAIAQGMLSQDNDHRLTTRDRKSLRRMYLAGLITAGACALGGWACL